MPGNYVVNQRSNGEGIDAPKYLADHQLHIDNLEPAKIDDYSGSVAQMQASTDPGELSSESQPTALSGELERLRWAIRQATGMVQWYQTPPTDLTTLFQALSPLNLTNKTGVALVVGDVVGLDEGNDSAVKLVDTVTSLWPMVVAREAIANNVLGTFAQAGVPTVLVTGAVTRGHYLRKSATTKALETTGIAVGTAQAQPIGAVAVALQAAAGPGVSTIPALFFGTPQGLGLTPAFTAVLLGTNPATVGALRLPNVGPINARTAANDGDRQLLELDASNRVHIGPGGTGQIRMDGQVRCDIDNKGLVLPSTYAT